MMVRHLCAFLFVVAVVYAGGDSDESSEVEGISVGEYKEEFEEYVKNIMNLADGVGEVEELAHQAFQDPTGKLWDKVGSEFGGLVGEISGMFEKETQRLTELVHRLWTKTEDFRLPEVCDSTYKLLQRKDTSFHLGFELALSFTEDIGCFKAAFASVQEVPLDSMVAGQFSEHDAISLIGECGNRMFVIRHAAERFVTSLATLHQEVTSDADKRALTKLYRLLSDLKDSKK